MNGVIVLSTRSGACLYAQSYADDFGLPSSGDQNQHFPAGGGGGGRAQGGASSPAAMQLAGLIFALDMHAAELVTPGDDGGGSSAGGARGVETATTAAANGGGGGVGGMTVEGNSNELKRWAVGDCVLHFRKDRRRHVLVVVFSAAGMGDDVPAELADTILSAFTVKHGKHLDAPGGPPPGKSLRFTSELHAAFQTKPSEIARGIVRKLGLRSPWVYAALSEELLLSWGRGMQEWDDDVRGGGRGGRGRGRGDGGGGGGDDDAMFGAAPGEISRGGGGGGGGGVGVGNCSGIPFRESERGARKGGGGGGSWFCMGKSTAVTPLASSSSVGAIQFIHRIRPEDDEDGGVDDGAEAEAGSKSAGSREEEGEDEARGWSVDDVLPRAALEGLVAVVHSAAAVMETLPPAGSGGGGGLRSMEVAVAGVGGGGVGGGGGGGAGGGGDTVRVMVYCWDNFVLALPVTAADVARSGRQHGMYVDAAGADTAGAVGLGLHAAVVRGAVHEDMRRLHRLLRFVESAVPQSKLKLRAR